MPSISSKYPVPKGPFDLLIKPAAPAAGRVRVSQQFIETIHSGADNRVRVSQQFIETIHSGADNRVRVSQHYIEVIHEFGTPPVNDKPSKGKGKDGAPGQNRTNYQLAAALRWARDRRRQSGTFSDSFFIHEPHVPPPDFVADVFETVKVTLSPSGHTARRT